MAGSSSRSDICLVCFDIGRVMSRLVDGWEHACALAGVPLPPRIHEPDVQAGVERLCALHETGQIDNARFDELTAQVTGLTPPQVAAVACQWLQGPYPGIDELIGDLLARGVKTACLSNTNARHWRLMYDEPRTRLPMELLDYCFASHLVGAMKPGPAIYEHVERVSAAPPAAIAYYDDAAPNVEAALQRGWQAMHVTSLEEPVAQVRGHLRELGVL
jgi:HAD superfamily hydrolase (TIGR01509 family)